MTFSEHDQQIKNKYIRLLLFFILTMFFCLGSTCEAQLPPLTNAESWVLDRVVLGKVADLAQRFSDEKDHVIRASFIEDILTGSLQNVRVPPYGVHIESAIVSGPLDLSNVKIPHDSKFINCRFMAPVKLSNSFFAESINFSRSVFSSFASFDGIKVNKTVFIRHALFKRGLDLHASEISGSLEILSSEFTSDTEAANFNSLKIGGLAFLNNNKFFGPVNMTNAQIHGGALVLDGTEFRNQKETVYFSQITLDGTVWLHDAKFFGPVEFIGSKIFGKFEGRRTEFRNKEKAAVFDSMKVEGSFILLHAKFSGKASFNSVHILGDLEVVETEFLTSNECALFNYAEIGGHASFVKSKFHGPVCFNFVRVSRNVELENTIFEGYASFIKINVLGVFQALNSNFSNPDTLADFNSMKVGGYASFKNTIFAGAASFIGSEITSDFSIVKTEFMNQGKLANFNSVKLGGHFICENSKFSGPADFTLAEISGGILTRNTEFSGKNGIVQFHGTKVKGPVNFENTKFAGAVSFQQVEINSYFKIKKTEFRHKNSVVDFNSVKVSSHLIFENSKFSGPVDFTLVEISGGLSISETDFNGKKEKVCFDGIKVKGPLILQNVKFAGAVSFLLAKVQSNFNITGVRFEDISQPVNFDNVESNSKLFFKNTYVAGTVSMKGTKLFELHIDGDEMEGKNPHSYSIDLSGSVIEGECKINNISFQRMIASSLRVNGLMHLYNVAITDELNLENSKVVTLKLSNLAWSQNAIIRLLGMTYSSIYAGDTRNSWEDLLKLVNHSIYSADLYTNLETFFNRQGYSDRAQRVYVERKERENREFAGLIERYWNYFLKYFVYYGFYPALAFIWCAGIVLIGCFVFRFKNMEPQNINNPPAYSSFWYSLDVFIPFINLKIAEAWQPKQSLQIPKYCFYILSLLGWILIPIGLLAISKIIK